MKHRKEHTGTPDSTSTPSTQIYSNPLARPPTHTPQEPEEDLTFTRLSTPTQSPGVIQSKHTNQATHFPCCPTTKNCSQTHHHSPYSRPSTWSSNPFPKPYTHYSPFSGPFSPLELSINQLLTHLIAMQGTPNTTPQEVNQLLAEPTSPSIRESNITSSQVSSPTSQSTISSDSNSDDSIRDQSTVSSTSDPQLQSHLPINYNETLLKKLHGHPQIRTSTPSQYHFKQVQAQIQKEKIWTHHNLYKQTLNYFSHHSLLIFLLSL